MRIWGIEKAVDNKLNEQVKFKKRHGLLSREFFLKKGKTKKHPLEIANELEELVRNIEEENDDSYAILDYICQYRDKKGFDKDVANYGVDKRVRNIFKSGILSKKKIEDRLKSVATDIEDEKERITVELFFVNRMPKLINEVMEYYFVKDSIYRELLSKFRNKHKEFFEKVILTNEDIEKITCWGKDNGVYESKIYEFIAYTKLKLLADYFYSIKNKDLKEFTEKYPNNIYWDDKHECITIILENYAFPISFHYINESSNSDNFNPQNYDMNIDRNVDKYIDCFPIKLNAKERKAFDKVMKREYPECIPVKNQNNEEQDIEHNNTEKNGESDREQMFQNIEKEKGKEVIKDMGEAKEEVQKIKDGNNAKGGKIRYRANEEIGKIVADELKNAGVISDISEEYLQKLAYVSPKQKMKLEKVYNDIKGIVTNLGIEEDKVDTETAKLFAYLKLLDRGFWASGNSKGPSFEDYVKKAMEEMGTIYGKEFFDGISIGEDVESLKGYMDEKLPRPRGKRIKGAATIKKVLEQGQENDEKEHEFCEDKYEAHGEKHEFEEVKSEENSAIETNIEENLNEKSEVETDNSKDEKEKTSTEVSYTEEDKAEMEKLKSESGEELTVSLKEIIHNLQEEHRELGKLKKELEQKNEECRSRIASIGIDYKRYTKSIQDIEAVLNDSENVEFLKQIGELENLQNKYNSIKRKLEELEEIQSELREGNGKIEQIDSRQQQIEEEVKAKIEEEFRDL